jgi:hypothetical protein
VSGFSKAKSRIDAAAPGLAPWVLHELRHTAASGMPRPAISPPVIEAVLNHRSGIIRGVPAVYNRYAYEMGRGVARDQWPRHVELILVRPVRSRVDALLRDSPRGRFFTAVGGRASLATEFFH